MEEYEEELKRLLKKITPNVETYFGEFSSLNDIKIDTRKVPYIYVDFLGEKPDRNSNTLSFSLYLVNAAFSANEKLRDAKKHGIYFLIEEVNKALKNKGISKNSLIRVKGSQKILDSKAQNAYLVIFKKDIDLYTENC